MITTCDVFPLVNFFYVSVFVNHQIVIKTRKSTKCKYTRCWLQARAKTSPLERKNPSISSYRYLLTNTKTLENARYKITSNTFVTILMQFSFFKWQGSYFSLYCHKSPSLACQCLKRFSVSFLLYYLGTGLDLLHNSRYCLSLGFLLF